MAVMDFPHYSIIKIYKDANLSMLKQLKKLMNGLVRNLNIKMIKEYIKPFKYFNIRIMIQAMNTYLILQSFKHMSITIT
jgi:hypothetical protein